MNIVHIAYHDSSRSDGVMTVLKSLIKEQIVLGNNVCLININTSAEKTLPYEIVYSSNEQIKEVLLGAKPDVVIIHMIYMMAAVKLSWLLNYLKIPYLVQPHGGFSILAQRRKWYKKIIANHLLVNRFVKKSKGVVYLNINERNNSIYSKESIVVPNGIEMPAQYNKPLNEGINFLFLSRIDVNQKGLDVIIPAWNIFIKQHSIYNHNLTICGDFTSDKDRIRFTKLVKDVSNLKYIGHVDGVEKDIVFKQSDILILASRYEGMPMSILEALSYKIPCIVSELTNVADIIENNHCGWICDVDQNNIVEVLDKASSDFQNKRDIYLANTYNTAEKYSWKRIAELSIYQYNRLIKNE